MSDAWSLSTTTLVGRVGRDVEVKTSKGNNPTKYAFFTMSTHQRFPKGGKKTTWHNISVWMPWLVEFAGKYVKRKMLVVVVGRNDTRQWKERCECGREYTKTSTDVRADKILFVERKEESSDEPEEETAAPITKDQPKEEMSNYF